MHCSSRPSAVALLPLQHVAESPFQLAILVTFLFPDNPEKDITATLISGFNIISTDSPEQEKKLGFQLVPQIIKDYLNYCKHLKFEQTPDYDYLYSMLLTEIP